MGSQESKLEQPSKHEDEVKETTLTESAPSSPILTPLDPRSPSVNIARTPLEVILGHKTTEESADELDEDDSVESKDSVNVILGIDPRSPTVEFNRTPIIVGAVAKDKSSKLQNKNLDKVRNSEIQTTPVTRKSNIIPPKLLEVSPVSVVSNYNKRKSFVGLLETNLDFTETDLDKVCQAKDNLNKSLPVEMVQDLPCNKLKEQMKSLQIESDLSKLTPEKCEKSEQTNGKEFELSNNKTEEKAINITAQVKDFDKKLTNLIYEDDGDDQKSNLRITKVKENNRTPLGIRNSNENAKRGTNRLKVSDKPRRSDSKIPVFKDHYYKKVGVQCENTPPNQFEESQRKPKVSQWDADKTLII